MQLFQDRCFQLPIPSYLPWLTTCSPMAISPIMRSGSPLSRPIPVNPWTVNLHGVSFLSPNRTDTHAHCFDFRRNWSQQVHWDHQLRVWFHLFYTVIQHWHQISVLAPLLRRPVSFGVLISPFATVPLPPSWQMPLVSLTLVKRFPSSFVLSNQVLRGNSQELPSFFLLQMLSPSINKPQVPS